MDRRRGQRVRIGEGIGVRTEEEGTAMQSGMGGVG